MAGIGDAQLGQTLNWRNVQNNPKHFYDTSKYKFPGDMLHNLFDLSTGSLYALAEFLLGLQEPFQFLLNDSTVSQQAKPNTSLNNEAEAFVEEPDTHVNEESNVHDNEPENDGAEAHVEEPDTHVDEEHDAHLDEEFGAHINELGNKAPYPCLNNDTAAHVEEPDIHVDKEADTHLSKKPGAHTNEPDNDLNKPTVYQPDAATQLGGECGSFKPILEQPTGKAPCPSGGTEKGKGRKRMAESHVTSVSGIVSPPSKRTRSSRYSCPLLYVDWAFFQTVYSP